MPLSHSHQAVRHAICALGGAHRVFKLQRSGASPALQTIQRVSLRQYNLAIGAVKSLMETSTAADVTTILTCCVIFISLENLYGHYAESLRHLKAGSSLLTSWSACTSNLSALSRPSQEVLDSFAQTLCRLGDDVWGYLREMIAPELNCYFTTAERPDYTGEQFETVDAAEQALHNITKLFEAEQSVVERKFLAYAQYGYSPYQRHFMPAGGPPTHDGLSFEVLSGRFHQWSTAFDSFRQLFAENHRSAKDTMRIRALAVDQALWTGWLRCNAWRDYQQEDLDEIIQRAEALAQLEAFKSGPVFAFDGSFILCIAMACVTTTDSDTQWRAIRLLRSVWRREGIWDSQELADILEAMVHATSSGLLSKDMLPWDVPHLARMLESLSLNDVRIPVGPLSLVDHTSTDK